MLAPASSIDAQRWRAAEGGFHAHPWEAMSDRVKRSSRDLPWRGLWVWQHGGPVEDLYLAPTAGHCLIFRNGPITRLLQRHGGETQARDWSSGEVVIVPAGTPTFWRSERPRDNVHVDILPQWLEQASGGRPVRLASCFGARDPLLAQLAQVLLAALDDNTALQPSFGEAMASAIALHLLEHYADATANPERAWSLSARQLRTVTDFVRSHLHSACDVSRLAALVELSPAHFSRCFKATCGDSPHQFVMRLKMEHARELLLTTGLTVGDVMSATGFASRAHFAQVFRRHWGTPPASARRQG